MADPVVATCLYAETRGLISFATCDGSRQWWAGARMRLVGARNEMTARVSELEAQRLIGEMAIQGLDRDSARRLATIAQQRFEAAIKPWIEAPALEAASGGADDLDLVAMWYIMEQPEMLKRLGVDFGPVESLS